MIKKFFIALFILAALVVGGVYAWLYAPESWTYMRVGRLHNFPEEDGNVIFNITSLEEEQTRDALAHIAWNLSQKKTYSAQDIELYKKANPNLALLIESVGKDKPETDNPILLALYGKFFAEKANDTLRNIALAACESRVSKLNELSRKRTIIPDALLKVMKYCPISGKKYRTSPYSCKHCSKIEKDEKALAECELLLKATLAENCEPGEHFEELLAMSGKLSDSASVVYYGCRFGAGLKEMAALCPKGTVYAIADSEAELGVLEFLAELLNKEPKLAKVKVFSRKVMYDNIKPGSIKVIYCLDNCEASAWGKWPELAGLLESGGKLVFSQGAITSMLQRLSQEFMTEKLEPCGMKFVSATVYNDADPPGHAFCFGKK